MARRLSDALSPYLEQHADQPVDWYPWTPEALQAARTTDRPILLSIGYSACHWCHVMARESFDDPGIAERMNDWFVNIKVDREERPDLDHVYQLGHQLLTGRPGGWPLTVFLDPTDLAPFVAGTYFPPEARHGLIGFPELLERVHDAWLGKRETLKAQNRRLHEAFELVSERRIEGGGTAAAEDRLLGQLDARRDLRNGGFGDAPKFPQAPLMAWLLERSGDDPQAASMLVDALRPMARHGLFDQLGGGFFRYCTDAAWEIPHFEKMLAESAQLLPVYAEAAVRWNDAELAEVAARCAEFLGGPMRLDGGGFAASLSADSVPPEDDPRRDEDDPDRELEGAYYLWTPDRIGAALEETDAELAAARFGLDGPANFEGRLWHLVQARGIDELTGDGRSADEVRERLAEIRGRLLSRRAERPAPFRDDKMLAAPNALAAAGLARAGRLLGHNEWIEEAAIVLEAVGERLGRGTAMQAVWRSGRGAAQNALLDDRAAVLLAALELLGCRWEREWYETAVEQARAILDRHVDASGDALYLTPSDHEGLVFRPPALTDDALPSGAGMAALGLARLGHLAGEAEWTERARRIVERAAGEMLQVPTSHVTLLRARRELDEPAPQVRLGGDADTTADWARTLRRSPDWTCLHVPPGEAGLPEALEPLADRDRPTAIVCTGRTCSEPLHDLESVRQRLERWRD